jgi:hypothetical protein
MGPDKFGEEGTGSSMNTVRDRRTYVRILTIVLVFIGQYI